MNAPFLNRRSFLKQNCGAITSVGLLSNILQLQLVNKVLASTGPLNDYRALVCIHLGGGLDGYNTLIPRESDEYRTYENLRTSIAVAEEDLLPIVDQNGRQFGIAPSMPNTAALYNQGDLAFLANVGTLIRPTTLADYNNGLALPKNLFSHRDQALEWQSSIPQDPGAAAGWAGRMADILNESKNTEISMNISLSGQNLLLTGEEVVPYTISENGSAGLQYYRNTGNTLERARSAAMQSMLDQTYRNLYHQTIARQTKNTQEAHEVFSAAIANAPELSDATIDAFRIPGGNPAFLSGHLQMIARTIAAHESLGACRQIFFLNIGGWDDHGALNLDLPPRQANLDALLGGFHAALTELGLLDRVITFTTSEFGRNLTVNGDGTDHAWAGHQLIMGGPVDGGKIFGEYPEDLSNAFSNRVNSDIGIGRGGRFVPTTAVTEYAAELALWMGLENNNDLETVLPNIRSFYSRDAADKPIGYTS